MIRKLANNLFKAISIESTLKFTFAVALQPGSSGLMRLSSHSQLGSRLVCIAVGHLGSSRALLSITLLANLCSVNHLGNSNYSLISPLTPFLLLLLPTPDPSSSDEKAIKNGDDTQIQLKRLIQECRPVTHPDHHRSDLI
jgi:hypothetical protein